MRNFIFNKNHLASFSLSWMDSIKWALKRLAKDIDRAACEEGTTKKEGDTLMEALNLVEDLITLTDEFTERMTHLQEEF